MNKLSGEKSPYLLQHKNNPVDWYPWGNEALEKALNENKPIILSIGYSSCHWCHVMEHESFEDQEVAQRMNQNFVNIKVDREERPDIDAIYMEAVQNMGLRGGWPLNVFLTPEKKPFYGGTYFPKNNWINLLSGVNNAFKTNHQKIEESAEGFAQSLQVSEVSKYDLFVAKDNALDKNEIIEILADISKYFDYTHGGLQRAPKFPMPSVWIFLLNSLSVIDDEVIKNQLILTLKKISLGGIFDHLAGGWTRYSTDEVWMVPHFEKMLYDNGQLLSLFTNTFAFFSKNSKINNNSEDLFLFQWACRSTVNWLKSEMCHENGGFFSALDADSDGKEGEYYVWKESELRDILKDDFHIFKTTYNISEKGNWEHGNNILHLSQVPNNFSSLVSMHETLLLARFKRNRPSLDNKLLCTWNALMLNGLIDYLNTWDSEQIKELVINNLDFIEQHLLVFDNYKVIGLKHQFDSNLLAFLDDYSALIQAFINYYQFSFEEKYLHFANDLTLLCFENFFDKNESLFYFTDAKAEKLIARKKEVFDNVIPSSNSIMVKNLYCLGRIFENQYYIDVSKQMFSLVKKMLIKDVQWLSNWADAGLLMFIEPVEIVVFGKNFLEIISEIKKHRYLPSAVYAGSDDKNSKLPLLDGRKTETTTIYICKNKTCHLPVYNVEEALNLL
jgi:uncharacterized protein YyaL (SSP411 family)